MKHHRMIFSLAALIMAMFPKHPVPTATAASTPLAVAISEIMYNPASSERRPVRTEWVEIYNAGQTDIDVSGWYLEDEDGKTSPLPGEAILAARHAIVLIPGKQTIENFHAAWGDDIDVYPLAHWSGSGSLHGLSNSPSPTNEILTLRTHTDQVVDIVNYDDHAPWPSDRHAGASIYVTPGSVDAKHNDDGARWRTSRAGVLGARNATKTDQFSSHDVGSPGFVIYETDSPVSPKGPGSGNGAP